METSKLCYYTQAWTLAWDGVPLFSEEFQAWTNGPVCPELYNEHRGRYQISCYNIDKGNVAELNDNEIENISIILNDYGNKEAYWLREQTHNEDPWRIARGSLPETASSKEIITKESMGIYYGGL